MLSKKDILRPLVGTILFQPFALLWCWLTDTPYWQSIGPFIIYATICFIPIYAWFEHVYD